MEKATAQTTLFQENTLKPSRMPKGIRLKHAINELINTPKANANPNPKTTEICETCTSKRKSKAKKMFVDGPTIEIFPIVFLSAIPPIMTAPGEIILNGEIIDNKVMIAPHTVILNSAHNP